MFVAPCALAPKKCCWCDARPSSPGKALPDQRSSRQYGTTRLSETTCPLAGEQDDDLGLAPHRVVVPDALDGLHQLARPGSWTYPMRPAALRLGVLGPAVQRRATRPDPGRSLLGRETVRAERHPALHRRATDRGYA